MTSFRLKQIGFALCLMASLLVGSASACMCSHHQEEPKSSETSCHSSHEEQAETTESAAAENAFEVDCICFVNQPTPYVVSKSKNKNLKADENISNTDQIFPVAEFIVVMALDSLSPELTRDLSYSNILESLLPSRAPPRL